MSIASIHTLKSKVGLADAEYRALLQEVAGVTSSKLLSKDGDRAVMERLQSLMEAQMSRPKTPTESKIWALWFDLRGYLPRREQTLAYLLGIVRRASGNQNIKAAADLGGLTGKEAYNAIESLKHRLSQEREKYAREEVPF